MTALDHLQDEALHRELRARFRQLVDDLILDPEFEYEICDIEVLSREPAYTSDIEYEVVLRVVTNNRAQLLGQASPFDTGDFRGYYNLLYGGWLTSYIAQTRQIDSRFFVSVDAIPASDAGDRRLDSEMTLSAAIEAGILTTDSVLASKMRQYGLTRLVLGGGAAIAGPLPGPIRTMERLCARYEIETILDVFCGSGAMSRVVLEHGGTDAYCLDVDCDCARTNLAAEETTVTFLEEDFFEVSLPDRQFDITVLDPYFNLLPDVLDSRLPEITARSNRVLLTAGFLSDGYWVDKIESKLASEVASTERFTTGRTVQLVGHV